MKQIFRCFAAFILVGLLLVKVAAPHVYEHFDSAEGAPDDCELCVLAIEGQNIESFLPTVITIEQLTLPILSSSLPSYVAQRDIFTIDKGILFLRPPPYHLA